MASATAIAGDVSITIDSALGLAAMNAAIGAFTSVNAFAALVPDDPIDGAANVMLAGRASSMNASSSGPSDANGAAHAGSVVVPKLVAAF